MSKTAYVFAGQGAQYEGMGRNLYKESLRAQQLMDEADKIIGFSLTSVMFEGSAEDLKQTSVTQPALYVHSMAQIESAGKGFRPDAVAGHSLGEFSALAAAKVLSFKDGLELVIARANAMQKACDAVPGTMAAVLGMENQAVEELCEETAGIVVAANYNCPGQLVISGELKAVEDAVENAKTRGARRALILPVGGAFHSPLMEPARVSLAEKIEKLDFKEPLFPIYQNVIANAVTDPSEIKENLISQLTGAVKWTQTIEKMKEDGIDRFIEVGGSGKILSGLIRKVDRGLTIESIQ